MHAEQLAAGRPITRDLELRLWTDTQPRTVWQLHHRDIGNRDVLAQVTWLDAGAAQSYQLR